MKVSVLDRRVGFIQAGLADVIDRCLEAGIELELIADQVVREGERLTAKVKADGREPVELIPDDGILSWAKPR